MNNEINRMVYYQLFRQVIKVSRNDEIPLDLGECSFVIDVWLVEPKDLLIPPPKISPFSLSSVLLWLGLGTSVSVLEPV
jgi:hypothetical protein